MGLDINSVRFLISARKTGTRFDEVLQIGRQDLNVYPAKMVKLLEAQGLSGEFFRPGASDTGYAEPCFKALGAKNVYSLDASAFEGAAFVHDLNEPIPSHLRERFDIVYDGGTLEHVFNFPSALRNCMEMVNIGGRLFIHTVANSYCGHGFYQFSPELFYRALNDQNGYHIERMILHATGPYGRWYEVADPEKIRARVELITLFPMQLLIQAQRDRATPIFATPPQQSDYTPRWGQPAAPAAPEKKRGHFAVSRPILAKVLPGAARLLHVFRIGLGLLRSHTLRNRKSFRPVKKP